MSVNHQDPTDEGEDQDVVDLLLEQHNQVTRLFADLEQESGEQAQSDLERLVRLLAVHETAEEEVVYPAVRKEVDGGDDLADARVEEESQAKSALSELEAFGAEHPGFASRLAAFKDLVLAHAESEEGEVFPALRQSHSRDQLMTMARAVRAAESFAPTHPHPHGPDSAVGNLAVGPFVAVADRVRDAIRNLRR